MSAERSSSAGPPLGPLTEHRSDVAWMSGTGLTVVGGLALFAGSAMAATSGGCMASVTAGSCPTNTEKGDVGLGVAIGGLVGMAIGIPLIVHGAKRVPIQKDSVSRSALVGTPAARGWSWQF